MIITKTCIVILLVIVISVLINAIEDYRRKCKCGISFNASMNALKVPIITFTNNKKSLNFLIDTGSDASYINKSTVKQLIVKKKVNDKVVIDCASGQMVSYGIATLVLQHNEELYEDSFEIADVTHMWQDVSEKVGIPIHGILGSCFMEKYNYVLDFKEMIAYPKK